MTRELATSRDQRREETVPVGLRRLAIVQQLEGLALRRLAAERGDADRDADTALTRATVRGEAIGIGRFAARPTAAELETAVAQAYALGAEVVVVTAKTAAARSGRYAYKLLARTEGIMVEPACAAPLAGLIRCIAAGEIPDGALVTERDGWEFDPDLAREELARHFGVHSLEGFGVGGDAAPAVGARL